jgi:acyl-CoA thioester hydrolase
MFSHATQIRVRYAETDQMGYVYYGNYATYFEVARVETMRAFGITYKELEEDGVMMPVLEYKSKYIRPAKYDDLLTVTIFIKSMPTARILFEYEIKNEAGVLLNVAETTLVFIDMATNKPCPVPANFKNMLQKYFDHE